MNKIIRVLLLEFTIFVLSISGNARADELQEAFLADMAAGLTARWSNDIDDSTLMKSEFIEYRTSLVEEELSRLSKYEENAFENAKFDLLAHAYIEALEMQRNALKYYFEVESLYNVEWGAGYDVRAFIIPYFYDHYGLEVDGQEVDDFRNSNLQLSFSVSENEETAATDKQNPELYYLDGEFREIEGERLVCVYTEYINNLDESTLPADHVNVKAYQYGAEIPVIIFTGQKIDEYNQCDTSVQSGATVKIIWMFQPEDESPVSIELSNGGKYEIVP